MTSGDSGKPKRLKVYPQRFVLASLKQDQLSGCALALLKLLLYPESKTRFFSFTDSCCEISLLLEESALNVFQEDTVQLTTQRWRAIQFDEGPLGFESTGIVNSVALPLAKEEINIYYVSTYNSGLTLVEENLIDSAIACLKKAGFTFSNESELNLATSGNELVSDSPLGSSVGSTGSVGRARLKPSECSMVITKLPYQLYITSLAKTSIGSLAEHLIKLLFFPERSTRFFSYTETPDEVTVSAALLPTTIMLFDFTNISEGAYGSHGTETVSKFAKPLAEARISIMNVSTYFNDYTLVEETNMDKSLDELRKSLNVIVDEFEEL